MGRKRKINNTKIEAIGLRDDGNDNKKCMNKSIKFHCE